RACLLRGFRSFLTRFCFSFSVTTPSSPFPTSSSSSSSTKRWLADCARKTSDMPGETRASRQINPKQFQTDRESPHTHTHTHTYT
ncbi:hypothetical protein QBC43DRAFT_324873, partial [Cladorrhinum sp. PSN259]